MLLSSTGLLLALTAPRSALAGKADDAEVLRLSTELRDRVADSRWQAADDLYRRMVAIPGARPVYQDHWRGFLAAQALGEANAEARRLDAAAQVDATAQVLTAQAMLMAWYGRVDLRVSPKVDPRPPLVMLDMPFEADQRHVLEAAVTATQVDGRYVGLLPLGRYELGSVSFEILGEDQPVGVKLKR